jgi:cell shape-determining protein MreC
MNFRSAKKKKAQQKQGFLFTLVLVLVVLGFSGVYRALSVGAGPFSLPFWQLTHGEGLSLSFVIKDKHRLEKKIAVLEQERAELQIELSRVEMFRQENEAFKNIETNLEGRQAKIAAILVKPNHTLYDSMIIDLGSEDGIREGDLVLGFGSVALGKIVDVRSNISHVELFTESPVASSFVHVPSSVFVSAVGHGGGMITFTLPRDVTVAVGDLLSYPGRTGLLFGTIEHIKFDATDPVQTILAESAVNINQLQYVQVIEGYVEQF